MSTIYKNNLNKIKETSHTWGRREIGNAAKVGSIDEANFRNKINPVWTNKKPDYTFQTAVSPLGNRAPYDLELVFNNRTSTQIVAKIEVECGKEQYDWAKTGKIPSQYRWPSGLNCLARKNYPESTYFIKFNETVTSAFLVKSKLIVDSVNSGRVKMEKKTRGKCAVQNTTWEVYPLDWPLVEQSVKNGDICLIEDDDWGKLVDFIIADLKL